jgi:hypothetical protein
VKRYTISVALPPPTHPELIRALARLYFRASACSRCWKSDTRDIRTIVANLGCRLAWFEVEITSAGDRYHTIKADDLGSLRPVCDGDAGFLAILEPRIPSGGR